MTPATSDQTPRVTICLPVSAGAADLTETLDAIRAQSFGAYRVALSLDGPDEAAQALCEAAAEAPEVSYSLRPDPIGRLGNLNHLLFQADTEYTCLLPANGLPEPGYLEALVAALDAAPRAVLASGATPEATGTEPLQRGLAVLSGFDAADAVSGLIRTEALAAAGRLASTAAGDLGAEVTFAAQLAREGALLHVPGAQMRAKAGAAAAALPSEEAIAAWGAHCVDIVEAALQTRCTMQEARLLWVAALGRLLSSRLAAPLTGPKGLPPAEYDAMIDGFLGRLETSVNVQVPFVLDQDWERLRRWSRGFCWAPRERETITDFGPQPVNAGQPFNVQPGGASAIWLKTEARLPPGTRIRFAGRILETEIDLHTATATVPADLTAKAGEFPVMLVDASGNPCSDQVTFWVLRATALGRAVVRMLRRMRGQPEPGSLKALPPPVKT